MDEEQTAGYNVPCACCSAVDWGVSDEGRFYCKSCHNIIERTREVEDAYIPGSNRISTISRGSRTKRPESGLQWVVCEAFQFILRNQADALIKLGVSPRFKDEVMCQLWRLYLQKSGQAYTHNPVRTIRFKVRGPNSESDSAPETQDTDTYLTSTASSNADSDWSQCSGSLDAPSYLSDRLRRTRSKLMSMMKTLALIHLGLVWIREALTLSDLLRLVNEGHVPYINAYEELPDEMKPRGKDALIFREDSVPSHRAVHQEAQTLAMFLQLPAFPPISRESLLHPALLSMRYLTDANLPDQLHPWVCRLMKQADMADQQCHTFDRVVGPSLPQYDVQTAALIIVTMKLLFGLDDHTEWDLSNNVGEQEDAENMFNMRRWFRLVESALVRAQRSREQDVARKQWMAKKPLYPDSTKKCAVIKRKRIAEQVQMCFEKVSSRPAGAERGAPSSFRFCWGDVEGADGPSLHRKKLEGVLSWSINGHLIPSNSSYWLLELKPFQEVESALPRTFVWLLQLFCFMLDVKPVSLYEEVLRVEKRVNKAKHKLPRQRQRLRSGPGPEHGKS